MEFRLIPVDFSDLPGWAEDDPSMLIEAMARCRDHIVSKKPYRTGSLGISSDDLLPVLSEVVHSRPADAAAARAVFERSFRPFLIERLDGGQGFVTAYYEPEVEVRATPDAEFRFPFYRRPDDMVDVDDTNRPAGFDPYFAFGRLRDGNIETYPDRAAIDRGLLDGRGLEIAYARSKVDVFFIHIQGAARLTYPDGSVRRITYAAKTGHRFSPIGKLLIDRGEIDPAAISMAAIRGWLADHPEKADEVLWHNRSYIFFREAPVDDLNLGPIAAAKVPVVAGRSLAVDRLVHTFGTPFFVRSESLTHLDGGKPFGRTMLALDTGSAIVGPNRGDIFTGSGEEAGTLAGNVRNPADFYIFAPKAIAQRFEHGEG